MPARRSPIERAFFREDADGAAVFFPWGLGRRGYVLRGPTERRRAWRVCSLAIGALLLIAFWAADAVRAVSPGLEPPALDDALGALSAPAVALSLVGLGYFLWASRFVEPLVESPLRVSREERLREVAQETPLWKLALAGVGLCAVGAAIAWLDPGARWLGLLTLLLGAGVLAWSLVLRRALAGASRARTR